MTTSQAVTSVPFPRVCPARWLGISPHALDNHLDFIYKALDVNNLNAALIVAVRAGLITPKVDDAPEIAVRMAA